MKLDPIFSQLKHGTVIWRFVYHDLFCLILGNITTLNIKVPVVQAMFAIVKWTNFHTNDRRMLLNFVIYYREA